MNARARKVSKSICKLFVSNLGVMLILLKLVSSINGRVMLKINLARLSFPADEITSNLAPAMPMKIRMERMRIC
jgi:hypothetical protein